MQSWRRLFEYYQELEKKSNVDELRKICKKMVKISSNFENKEVKYFIENYENQLKIDLEYDEFEHFNKPNDFFIEGNTEFKNLYELQIKTIETPALEPICESKCLEFKYVQIKKPRKNWQDSYPGFYRLFFVSRADLKDFLILLKLSISAFKFRKMKKI